MDNNTAPTIHAQSKEGATAAVPTAGTPTLRTRAVPVGWVSLDAALAWVAFGNAVNLSEWDQRFYLGASRWMEYCPETFLADLRAIADAPGQARGGPALDMVVNEARRLLPPSSRKNLYGITPGSVPLEDLVAAARSILADTGDEVQGRKMREEISRASNDLRCAIASGTIKAFGLPGQDPADEERWPPKWPRGLIPPDVCAAPVTLGQGGIWPFALGDITDTLQGEMDTLWHEVLIDAPELVRVFPEPDDGAPTEPYRLTPPETKPRGAGGRPPVHNWKPFQDEIIRLLYLDGDHIKIKNLKLHMTEWAALNMQTTPELRTIERKVDEILPPGLLPECPACGTARRYGA